MSAKRKLSSSNKSQKTLLDISSVSSSLRSPNKIKLISALLLPKFLLRKIKNY